MIKTIFFDFGNVLAHFDHWRAVRQFARFTDMPPDEIYATLYDCKLEDDFERGLLTTPDYIAEARKRARIDLSPDEFLTYFIDIFTANRDVLDIIPKLKNDYRIVLASNTNAAHFTHYIAQFHDTFDCFSATPTSHQCGNRKPEQGFFDYCQQFANADPVECLFIDDVAMNIAGGKQHGWRTLHYQRGDRLEEKLKHVSGLGGLS